MRKLLMLENWARAAGFAAILIAAVVCTFIWAISYPPSPGNGPPTKQYNSSATTKQKTGDHDDGNANNVPATIQENPANPGTYEATRDEQERFNKAANERGLTVATWIPAFATGFLFLAAATQAVLFVWQLGLMRDGMKDTKIAADAARIGAVAAQRSAEIANRTMILNDRPWVEIEVTLTEGITVKPEEYTVDVRTIIKNVGRSPAIGTGIVVKLCPSIGIAITEHRETLDLLPLTGFGMGMGRVGINLFPNRKRTDDRQLSVGRSTAETPTDDGNGLFIVSAVYYGLPTGGRARYTSRIYMVINTDSPQTRLTGEGHFSLDRIMLISSGVGGAT